MKVELYYTEGCHLCEHAEIIIHQARMQGYIQPDVPLVKIDIAPDDALVEKYGVLIPVVKIQSAVDSLNWPFTLEDFKSYLHTN